ncbi:MAG: DUF3500 domain-containing protein [Lentimonas sp.]
MVKLAQSLLALVFMGASLASAHERELVKPLADAVRAYLESLDDEQLNKTQFSFDSKQRADWHYVPRERKGLPWAAMTPEQKLLSKQPFVLAFSELGHEKAKGVIMAETVLWEADGRSEYRNPENYFVTIFGQPSEAGSWGFAIEGHHLSVNITIVEGERIYVTPSFFGSNPDRFRHKELGEKRPLAGEADQALKLIEMFDEAQQAVANISDKPLKEIVTRADRIVAPLEATGLLASKMTKAQQAQLRVLITEYIGRYRAPIADDDMQKIDEAGFEKVSFLWAGAGVPGKPLYYRVQGPTFLLEYANVQNGGNHSHTVWRDFKNDFGYDALRAHLEAEH